ncbi:hypothetical protein [Streptomyces sp. NPDC003036]|uniref:ATP-dependent DNA ligase n=1 Tax=Streptomyces sp. NPDC003036 TaxID=3154442 RepID=UPI0033AB564A
MVLDGELVVWSQGRLSFEALQHRASAGARTVDQLANTLPAHFIAFDVLQLEGRELLTAPTSTAALCLPPPSTRSTLGPLRRASALRFASCRGRAPAACSYGCWPGSSYARRGSAAARLFAVVRCVRDGRPGAVQALRRLHRASGSCRAADCPLRRRGPPAALPTVVWASARASCRGRAAVPACVAAPRSPRCSARRLRALVRRLVGLRRRGSGLSRRSPSPGLLARPLRFASRRSRCPAPTE